MGTDNFPQNARICALIAAIIPFCRGSTSIQRHSSVLWLSSGLEFQAKSSVPNIQTFGLDPIILDKNFMASRQLTWTLSPKLWTHLYFHSEIQTWCDFTISFERHCIFGKGKNWPNFVSWKRMARFWTHCTSNLKHFGEFIWKSLYFWKKQKC